MIERLERSFAEMRRFTADAAHELRTPLAVIRNETEVALRSPRTTDEYARVLENLLEEVTRLRRPKECAAPSYGLFGHGRLAIGRGRVKGNSQDSHRQANA
jgi:His Kinase A (phospho-acceptor) domain